MNQQSATKQQRAGVKKTQKRRIGTGKKIINWLSSMNFAISLLLIISIASVVGTVIVQNQNINDYILDFGPFWFTVFNKLSLFDVYSATWFVVILLFLLISTSACVIRNTPTYLRDMRSFRLNAQEKSFKAFRHYQQIETNDNLDQIKQRAQAVLARAGYKSRIKERDGETLVAGRKGGMNRIGYILTHVGMIVILLGGLVDSKMQLKLHEALGLVEIETESMPVSQVPDSRKLDVGAIPAFRGSVNIPEGKWGDVAFIGLKDGYVVQNLPFKVEVHDFTIEYYDSGMPRSYMSDITVSAYDSDEEIRTVLEVNHPLRFMGYNIFQSSFGDGGTELTFDAWQLQGRAGVAQEIEGTVNDDRRFEFQDQQFTLEFTDFALFNVNPTEGPDGEREDKNFGPSVTFSLRAPTGEAIEYENYMSPVEFDGTSYFLSGVRPSPNMEQQFWYIPADERGQIDTFMRFLEVLTTRAEIMDIAENLVGQAPSDNPEASRAAAGSIADLVLTFATQGFSAMREDIEASLVERNVPEEAHDRARESSVRVVQSVLERAYIRVLQEQEVEEFTDFHQQFFEDSLDAISVIPIYGSPVFLQLTTFDHIQSTGLEITRSPGMFWVYLGSIMLTVGIFMLFYVHYRRAWVLIKPNNTDDDADGETKRYRLLIAGTDTRKNPDFDYEFDNMTAELKHDEQSKNVSQ